MIPAESMRKIQKQLEAELNRLLGDRETGQGKGDQRQGANLDRDDLAHNFALRERRMALRDVERAQLKQIESALAQIAAGTYGRCADCGGAIPLERLQIIPYATLCVRCQQVQERQQWRSD